MSRGIHFYGTRDDLLPVLDELENEVPLFYVAADCFDTPKPVRFETATEIPKLGRASHESAVSCDAYLMFPRGAPVKPRRIGDKFVFDQLENPESVWLSSGGPWDDDVLLYGRFSTASVSAWTKLVMRTVSRLASKRWRRVKAFYVGPEAFTLWEAGKRLTTAAQSPRTFDLTME